MPAIRSFAVLPAPGHADLLTVERQKIGDNGKRRTEIVVDDVRAVGAFLRLTPAEGDGGWWWSTVPTI